MEFEISAWVNKRPTKSIFISLKKELYYLLGEPSKLNFNELHKTINVPTYGNRNLFTVGENNKVYSICPSLQFDDLEDWVGKWLCELNDLTLEFIKKI